MRPTTRVSRTWLQFLLRRAVWLIFVVVDSFLLFLWRWKTNNNQKRNKEGRIRITSFHTQQCSTTTTTFWVKTFAALAYSPPIFWRVTVPVMDYWVLEIKRINSNKIQNNNKKNDPGQILLAAVAKKQKKGGGRPSNVCEVKSLSWLFILHCRQKDTRCVVRNYLMFRTAHLQFLVNLFVLFIRLFKVLSFVRLFVLESVGCQSVLKCRSWLRLGHVESSNSVHVLFYFAYSIIGQRDTNEIHGWERFFRLVKRTRNAWVSLFLSFFRYCKRSRRYKVYLILWRASDVFLMDQKKPVPVNNFKNFLLDCLFLFYYFDSLKSRKFYKRDDERTTSEIWLDEISRSRRH